MPFWTQRTGSSAAAGRRFRIRIAPRSIAFVATCGRFRNTSVRARRGTTRPSTSSSLTRNMADPGSVELGQAPDRNQTLDGAFLFCSACKAVHRVTRSDRAPIYLPDGTSIAADDLQEFRAAHRDHDLRLLERSSDAEMISHPRWDPMCR